MIPRTMTSNTPCGSRPPRNTRPASCSPIAPGPSMAPPPARLRTDGQHATYTCCPTPPVAGYVLLQRMTNRGQPDPCPDLARPGSDRVLRFALINDALQHDTKLARGLAALVIEHGIEPL